MLFKHLTKNAKERDRSVVVWVMRPGQFRNGYDERELPGTGYLAHTDGPCSVIPYTHQPGKTFGLTASIVLFSDPLENLNQCEPLGL